MNPIILSELVPMTWCQSEDRRITADDAEITLIEFYFIQVWMVHAVTAGQILVMNLVLEQDFVIWCEHGRLIY